LGRKAEGEEKEKRAPIRGKVSRKKPWVEARPTFILTTCKEEGFQKGSKKKSYGGKRNSEE